MLTLVRGHSFCPPSDVYVRHFLYLFYTLIKLYYTKALSDQALSLAPDLNSSLPEAKNLSVFSWFSNNISGATREMTSRWSHGRLTSPTGACISLSLVGSACISRLKSVQFLEEINVNTHRKMASLMVQCFKNPPCNAWDTACIPFLGRSHSPWSKEVRGPQLLSLSSRAHSLEATAMRSPHTTIKRNLRLRQREEARMN